MKPIIRVARWRANRAYRRIRGPQGLPQHILEEVRESMWRHDRQAARILEGDEFEAASVRCYTIHPSAMNMGYRFFGAGSLAREWRRNPNDYLR